MDGDRRSGRMVGVMRSSSPIVVAALLSTSVVAFAGSVPLSGQEEESIAAQKEEATPREIREVLDAWDEALGEGDVDALVRLLDEEIVLLPAGRDSLEDPEAVRKSYRALFAQYAVKRRSEVDEIVLAGRWAFVRGVESFVLEPVGGGGESLQTEERRMLSILHRGDDGRWRFARAMTNRGPERLQVQPKSPLQR